MAVVLALATAAPATVISWTCAGLLAFCPPISRLPSGAKAMPSAPLVVPMLLVPVKVRLVPLRWAVVVWTLGVPLNVV